MVSTIMTTSSSSAAISSFTFGIVHNVFRASVKLGVPLPAAKSLNLADRDFLDADLVQGILKLIQLERFDYRLYQAS
jgi:hypothetical protein